MHNIHRGSFDSFDEPQEKYVHHLTVIRYQSPTSSTLSVQVPANTSHRSSHRQHQLTDHAAVPVPAAPRSPLFIFACPLCQGCAMQPCLDPSSSPAPCMSAPRQTSSNDISRERSKLSGYSCNGICRRVLPSSSHTRPLPCHYGVAQV